MVQVNSIDNKFSSNAAKNEETTPLIFERWFFCGDKSMKSYVKVVQLYLQIFKRASVKKAACMNRMESPNRSCKNEVSPYIRDCHHASRP
jgi:hypothetical protein